MLFTSEKLADKIRLIRGYKSKDDKNYCMVMTICGDKDNLYELKGWLSNHPLSISEIKAFVKYLKSLGLKLYATTLGHDFARFYSRQSFKKIWLES